MKFSHEQLDKFRNIPAADWIRRIILAWLTAVTLEVCLLPAHLLDLSGLEGLAEMSGFRMILVALVVFVELSVSARLCRKNVQRWLMVAFFGFLAAVSLATSYTWAFLSACLMILAMLIIYARKGWKADEERIFRPVERPVFAIVTAGLALAFFILVSVWTVCRVYSFSTPSFDFSIFAQMFHSMRTTGLPMTTIERDGPLSHFAVHVSPIYYLMLPFYALVPRPETLQVLQAAVLASAVIPLWKLGKCHGLSPALRTMLCLVLLLYPAYAGGASYDIHENAFLTPLILWLFYGIDRKNIPLTAVAAALTLMVKEDAAVYVAVAALYLMLRDLLKGEKWGIKVGGSLLICSLIYFFAVTGYLSRSGDGVMTYRYRNFMFDGSDSLVTVIRAVLRNPMKAVYECVDPEKLEFLALTMLPLMCLPLMTRRYERFVLLIPYLLVNLMSDYQYQHSIFFQYTYGATACLIYLVLVNLTRFRLEKRRLQLLGLAVCIAAVCFTSNVLPKATRYPSYCVQYGSYYDAIRETLDVIPEDASVAATTYYTTYLSQRDVLYDVRYASAEHLLSCEYLALNTTDTKSYEKYGGYEEFKNLLQQSGYQLVAEHNGKLEIFWKK